MLPIILIIIAAMVFLSALPGAVSSVVSGGEIRYDENELQDYANDQYAAEFASSSAYEDHILIVFLTESEEYWDYAYIGWTGNHIDKPVKNLFGSNDSKLGISIAKNVNGASYKYSLDTDLTDVIADMKDEILALGLSTPFNTYCHDAEHRQVTSRLSNKTDMSLGESTINEALNEFTDETGIPIVVVVEDAEDAFGRTVEEVDVFTVVIALALVGAAIFLIVRSVRERKYGNDYGEDDAI